MINEIGLIIIEKVFESRKNLEKLKDSFSGGLSGASLVHAL